MLSMMRWHKPNSENATEIYKTKTACCEYTFIYLLGFSATVARQQKTMPSTRVERVTFPLQVERATTTPTRHYDRGVLSAHMIRSF